MRFIFNLKRYYFSLKACFDKFASETDLNQYNFYQHNILLLHENAYCQCSRDIKSGARNRVSLRVSLIRKLISKKSMPMTSARDFIYV